ncbi:MAG: sensor histidine kinase [Prolixibacteraceae bacterium]|nr:sensor histidine kinase [Prolixibacteraceae bacterium]
MKIIHIKNQVLNSLHLLFWFISYNFWNVILNPGVESTSVVQGFAVEGDFILLVNSLFLLYCSLPFIWLIRKKWLWIKIPVSILFLIPLGYLIFQWIRPDQNKEDVQVFVEYFVKNFLYVVVFHLTIVSAVYFNLKVLIVRFLNRSRFAVYLLYAGGLVLLTALLNYSLFNLVIDKLFPSLYYISYFRIWELVLIVAAYLIFTSILFLIWQYAQMLIEKRDAARNELSALKSQINPHFLFNNLNTIYSMASQKDERTPEVILQLSDFLRYVLYDTSSETIPLEKEVEIIQTYAGLQKERVNPEITQVLLTTEGNFSGINIAPLLLLPLAENCFKHGKGKNPGTIRIFIGYDGKNLIFNTENQIALREKTDPTENGGLGIPNVEKRLNLIYPDRHSLEYHENDGIFYLEMKVKLTK